MINFFFSKTPLVYFIQPIWRDEAFSYLLANKSLWEIIFLTAQDFNPPLYYFILHFWIKVFGSSVIALRSLSLIFFWATIYVIFLFFSKVFKLSLKKSFFYLILFLINPLLNYYAFEARMYTMFCFFATLSFYAFWQKNKKLYFWSTLLGLFTHYFMIFVIFAQILIYFFSPKNNLPFKKILIPSLIFTPWLIFVFFTKKSSLLSSFWIQTFPIKNLTLVPAIIYTGYEFSFEFLKNEFQQFFWFFLIFLIYIVLTILIGKNKKKKPLTVFLAIWGILIPFFVAIISQFKPIFLPRYLIFTNIGLILLVIFTLEKLPSLIKVFVFIFLFFQTFNYQQNQIAKRKKADFRQIIKEIKLLAKKDDLVYITDILNYFPVVYYFDEKRVFIYQKSYKEIPQYVGKVLINEEKIVFRLPIYPKKAFIIENSKKYQIQSNL